jgi:tight adherence protein B
VEKKIEALTAQGIMQGLIISLAPFMIMGVMMVSDPKFIAPLFNTTLGWVLLLVMFSLQIIGGIVIRRIVTIKV